jgi:hypothetical protein
VLPFLEHFLNESLWPDFHICWHYSVSTSCPNGAGLSRRGGRYGLQSHHSVQNQTRTRRWPYRATQENVPESARFAGCLEICIQQNQDDPNDIISNQYWETRKHYEDYFTWRTKEGVGAELQSLCSEPTSARFFADVIEAKAPTTA